MQLLSAVRKSVTFQHSSFTKWFLTLSTFVQLFFNMRQPEMLFQLAGIWKWLETDRARMFVDHHYWYWGLQLVFINSWQLLNMISCLQLGFHITFDVITFTFSLTNSNSMSIQEDENKYINWIQKRKDTLRLTRLCSFGGQFWWTNDVESLVLVARTRTGGGLNSRNFTAPLHWNAQYLSKKYLSKLLNILFPN